MPDREQRATLISLRLTKAERKQLMEIRAQRGCFNLSDTVRLLLGFPQHGRLPGLEGSDDIDSVDKLCSLVVAMIDRQDTQNKLLYQLAQHVGLKERRHVPTDDLVAPLPDVTVPLPSRNGAKHPELPAGFAR